MRYNTVKEEMHLEDIWGSKIGWQRLIPGRTFIRLDGSFMIYPLGARDLQKKWAQKSQCRLHSKAVNSHRFPFE